MPLNIVNGEKLDRMNRELVNSLHPRKPRFPAGVEVFSLTMCAESGPVGNRMFPKAQERPQGVSGTKWEPEGQIPLHSITP